MQFLFRPMRWRDARIIAEWHYPEPYSFYDLRLAPLLTHIALQRLFVLGGIGYYSVWSEDEALVGVFSFYFQEHILEVGLGLRPDLTGRRLGGDFIQAGLSFGRERFAPTAFRLEVALFNKRAISVYTRAGFAPGRVFVKRTHRGPMEFMEMTRLA